METNNILYEVDYSCDMAAVSLNGECIMEGNFGDFYPGCHGIEEWGDFNSPIQLYRNIRDILLKRGEKVYVEQKEYKYE